MRGSLRCGFRVKQSALYLPLLHLLQHTAPSSLHKSCFPVGTFISHPPVEIYNLDHRTGGCREEKRETEEGVVWVFKDR